MMASTSAMHPEGDCADPLTPVERTILDLLLKKQAQFEAATKIQAARNELKMENATDASQNGTSQDRTPSKNQSSHPSPKAQKNTASSSLSTVKEKISSSSTAQQSAPGPKWDDLGDRSLDDDDWDELIQYQFNIDGEMGESEVESSQESGMNPYETPARGRGGRGRGRGAGPKTNRGGRGGRAPTFSDIEGTMSREVDDSELDENDPVMKGYSYIGKMTDDQVVQFMTTYNEEKNLVGSVPLNTDEFAVWLVQKMQPFVDVPAQNKKVVSQKDLPKRASGRGRGRGRARGRGSRGG